MCVCVCRVAEASPSLKVQSWLRIEPNASSLDSVASSATLRSTYTIICFSCAQRQTSVTTAKIYTGVRVCFGFQSAKQMSNVYLNMTVFLWKVKTCVHLETYGRKVESLHETRLSLWPTCLFCFAGLFLLCLWNCAGELQMYLCTFCSLHILHK